MAVSLAALHTQLQALEDQKTLLASQLLSLRALHPLSSPLPSSSPPPPSSLPLPPSPLSSPPSFTPDLATPQLTDADILEHVFASSSTQHTSSLTRLHRITGITTFTVRDPSPPHGKLLGIRIEVFSQRKFQTPHYILLSFPPATTTGKPADKFAIHRHTLPPFLTLPQSRSNLAVFVRVVRRALLQHARRVAAVQGMKEKALAAGRVGDVMESWTNRVESVEWDEEVAVVVVKWRNGTTGWIKVGEEGKVRKVVVKGGSGRVAEVERRISGGLGEVARRMGWE